MTSESNYPSKAVTRYRKKAISSRFYDILILLWCNGSAICRINAFSNCRGQKFSCSRAVCLVFASVSKRLSFDMSQNIFPLMFLRPRCIQASPPLSRISPRRSAKMPLKAKIRDPAFSTQATRVIGNQPLLCLQGHLTKAQSRWQATTNQALSRSSLVMTRKMSSSTRITGCERSSLTDPAN